MGGIPGKKANLIAVLVDLAAFAVELLLNHEAATHDVGGGHTIKANAASEHGLDGVEHLNGLRRIRRARE